MRLVDADHLVSLVNDATILGDGFKQAFTAIVNGEPTIEPESKWISCSERLPEKAEGRYWVCTNTGYQCQCRWTDDVYGIGSNGEWAWKIFDIPQYSHVLAWMPLPEPYREDGEADEDD